MTPTPAAATTSPSMEFRLNRRFITILRRLTLTLLPSGLLCAVLGGLGLDTCLAAAVFLIPFALFFWIGWYTKSRYVVYVRPDELIVTEPPIRPMILRWDEVLRVTETRTGDVQIYGAPGSPICKVFSGIENAHLFVAELRRRLRPEVYAEAENLMRVIEFRNRPEQPR